MSAADLSRSKREKPDPCCDICSLRKNRRLINYSITHFNQKSIRKIVKVVFYLRLAAAVADVRSIRLFATDPVLAKTAPRPALEDQPSHKRCVNKIGAVAGSERSGCVETRGRDKTPNLTLRRRVVLSRRMGRTRCHRHSSRQPQRRHVAGSARGTASSGATITTSTPGGRPGAHPFFQASVSLVSSMH